MTTTHTHSAPPRADAAPDRFTPPTHRARHLIEIIRSERADPWIAGIAFAVLTYAGLVVAGGF